jgi:hypothetical protein
VLEWYADLLVGVSMISDEASEELDSEESNPRFRDPEVKVVAIVGAEASIWVIFGSVWLVLLKKG